MKVTIKDYLNVRVGKPSLNAPTFQYLAPGSVIEVEENIVLGDVFENKKQWYKDQANNYYWAGGFHPVSPEKSSLSANGQGNNYLSTLSIPADWKASGGENINIFVLDSGCVKHHAFGIRLLPLFNGMTKKVDAFSDEASDGHGTFICGLAGGELKGEFTGIALQANLKPFRVTLSGGAHPIYINNALDEILNNPHSNLILNLSLSIGDNPSIRQKINQLLTNGVVVVSSIPNEVDIFSKTINSFPSTIPGVIAVAKIEQSLFDSIKSQKVNPRIDYLLPDISYKSASSFFMDLSSELSGSSMATAIVSGAFACAKSINPDMSPMQLKQAMDTHVPSISSISSSQFNIYKNA